MKRFKYRLNLKYDFMSTVKNYFKKDLNTFVLR